jgi:hypothetical protein
VLRQNRHVVEEPGRRKRHRKVTMTVRGRRPPAAVCRRLSSHRPGCSRRACGRREENTTSSEVNGWPSAKTMFGRSLIVSKPSADRVELRRATARPPASRDSLEQAPASGRDYAIHHGACTS